MQLLLTILAICLLGIGARYAAMGRWTWMAVGMVIVLALAMCFGVGRDDDERRIL
jgi:hypothetical protein